MLPGSATFAAVAAANALVACVAAGPVRVGRGAAHASSMIHRLYLHVYACVVTSSCAKADECTSFAITNARAHRGTQRRAAAVLQCARVAARRRHPGTLDLGNEFDPTR